jgi:hypothetical protein
MKFATGLAMGIAVLAFAPAVQAAPKVAGKYALISTALCQTLITVQKDGQQRLTAIVTPNGGGVISADVGYIQFPATAASSGNFSIASKGFEANAVRISGSGSGVKPFTVNMEGQFTATETELTLTVGAQTQTFILSYGDVARCGEDHLFGAEGERHLPQHRHRHQAVSAGLATRLAPRFTRGAATFCA